MTTPAQPPPKGKGKKSAITSPMTWVIVLGVGLVAGAYLLYRRKGTAAASTAATTPQPNNEDVAGQIATLQGEIGDLQSTGAQDEAGETGTGTTAGTGTGTTAGPSVLPAPAGMSVTPRKLGANLGWGTVPGAKVYELVINGAGGAGTGTSHYDHVGAGNHASVSLAKGKYVARARAGLSATDVHGHWSANHPFTVPGGIVVAARPGTAARPGSESED